MTFFGLLGVHVEDLLFPSRYSSSLKQHVLGMRATKNGWAILQYVLVKPLPLLYDSSAVWSTPFRIWEGSLWKGVIKNRDTHPFLLEKSCILEHQTTASTIIVAARMLCKLTAVQSRGCIHIARGAHDMSQKQIIDVWKTLHSREPDFQYKYTIISLLLPSRKIRSRRFEPLNNEVSAACHSTLKKDYCKFFGEVWESHDVSQKCNVLILTVPSVCSRM